MTDDTDKADELLQQSKEQERRSAEPSSTNATDEANRTLADAVADAYRAVEEGERRENLTVRDENLAALIAGIEGMEQIEAIGQRAYERLGRDGEIDNRAGLLEALVRIGPDEVAAEEVEAGKQ